MPRTASAPSTTGLAFSPRERATLLLLQTHYLRYFLDNQTADGLILDRQANFGPPRGTGLCSTSATGMGFIALALASADPHRLLSVREAVTRIRRGLETALELPHTRGVLPHFVHAGTRTVAGADARSTVDNAWLVAGALWAGAFLEDLELERLANRLLARIDWRWWTAPNGLIRHGANELGRSFPCCWDRLNGETVAMYVLAAGASREQRWPAENWCRLGRFVGEAGGLRFRQRRPGPVRLPVRPRSARSEALAAARPRSPGRQRHGCRGQRAGLPCGGRSLRHLSAILGTVRRRRSRTGTRWVLLSRLFTC